MMSDRVNVKNLMVFLKKGDRVKLYIDEDLYYVTPFLDEHKKNNGIWEVYEDMVSPCCVWLKSDIKSSGRTDWEHEITGVCEISKLELIPDNLFEV